MFWLLGSWCFDCGAVGVLIVGQLMFWLWGSWCFDCGEVGVSIVEQLVFWLWGIWCFNFGAVGVLIVGQLVFWLWGSWCLDCGAVGVLIVGQLVFRLWGSWCFDCGAVGVLIVGQLVFWLWGSWSFDCGAVAQWELCGGCGDVTPASARPLPRLINGHIRISVEMTCRYGERAASYSVLSDGRRTWGGRTAWELNVGLERFTLSCSLTGSIQKGLGIGRNPHNWIRNVWWTFQIRAVVFIEFICTVRPHPSSKPKFDIRLLLGWLAAYRCIDDIAVMTVWLGVLFRKCCGTKQCWVIGTTQSYRQKKSTGVGDEIWTWNLQRR